MFRLSNAAAGPAAAAGATGGGEVETRATSASGLNEGESGRPRNRHAAGISSSDATAVTQTAMRFTATLTMPSLAESTSHTQDYQWPIGPTVEIPNALNRRPKRPIYRFSRRRCADNVTTALQCSMVIATNDAPLRAFATRYAVCCNYFEEQ
jgi:hypothetical protein